MDIESSSSEKSVREGLLGKDIQDLERVEPSRLKNKKYAVDKSVQISAKYVASPWHFLFFDSYGCSKQTHVI